MTGRVSRTGADDAPVGLLAQRVVERPAACGALQSPRHALSGNAHRVAHDSASRPTANTMLDGEDALKAASDTCPTGPTERDAELQGAAPHLFLRAEEQCLRAHRSGAGSTECLGAAVFIHHLGSSRNAPLHFHCVAIDAVFDAATTGGIIFTAATAVAANAVT
jgi:hypothetical protein